MSGRATKMPLISSITEEPAMMSEENVRKKYDEDSVDKPVNAAMQDDQISESASGGAAGENKSDSEKCEANPVGKHVNPILKEARLKDTASSGPTGGFSPLLPPLATGSYEDLAGLDELQGRLSDSYETCTDGENMIWQLDEPVRRKNKRRRQTSGTAATINSPVKIKISRKAKGRGKTNMRKAVLTRNVGDNANADDNKLDSIMAMIKNMSVSNVKQFEAINTNTETRFNELSTKISDMGDAIRQEVERTIADRLAPLRQEIKDTVIEAVDEKLKGVEGDLKDMIKDEVGKARGELRAVEGDLKEMIRDEVSKATGEFGKAKETVDSALLSMGKMATEESILNAKADLINLTNARMDEVEEKRRQDEARKRNVIIGGFPESDAANMEDRKKEDMVFVEKLLRWGNQEKLVQLKTVVRLGSKEKTKTVKGEELPRLAKLVFVSEDQRERFLASMQRLKEENPNHEQLGKLTFKRDVSKEDRDNFKQLLREKENRELAGEKNLEIRRGKLVKNDRPFRGYPPRGGRK